METPELKNIVLRIFLALFLGALVGFERQWRRRNAGLRTNGLVSLGACLYILISENIYTDDASPSRIASQIVTGIGFLGAGVIMKEGLNVRGLNTAATLWCSAAIGSLAGFGYFVEAIAGSLTVIGAHLLLRPLGLLIEKGPLTPGLNTITYKINILCNKKSEPSIRAMAINILTNHNLHLQSISSLERFFEADERFAEVEVILISAGRTDSQIEEIVNLLGIEKGVKKMSWEIIKNIEEEISD
jgi:putative Mg2+ transporter-C (MgtC) family protein